MIDQNLNSCQYFNAALCKSCSLLEKGKPPLPILPKELVELFAETLPWKRCATPFRSRAKAKMSVSGTVEKPIIGILDSKLQGVELLSCPLHKNIINAALREIPAELISHKIEPYSIKGRSGELKGLILQTNSGESGLRIRFVLKSKKNIAEIKSIAQKLSNKLSVDLLLSANFQPIPHQILEGEEEVHIFGETLLWEEYEIIKVAFPARSFMQVTPEIATALYSFVRETAKNLHAENIVDLFCGAGGFALSLAGKCNSVTGLDISFDAIESAKISAKENNLTNANFKSGDLSATFKTLTHLHPDTLIINPPRRGIGNAVIAWILNQKPKHIIYSSCNALSFIADIQKLNSLYRPLYCKPFEMFPLTEHYEIVGVLQRKEFA